MSHWHRVAALAAAVALLAGCSRTTPGTASAGSTGSGEATSGTSQPPTSTKPSVTRPKKIDLAGVDSCAVITDAQRRQFDLAKDPGRLPYPTHPEATLCSYRSSDFSYGMAVAVITTEGIEMYDDGVASGKAATMVVGSFPAVLSEFPGALQACFVGLDVADGQMIELQVDGAKLTMDDLCARATKIADAIVQTISAK